MAAVGINHTALEYLERGHGEPVVFVHGSDSDYRTWCLQHEEFGNRFRAIVYNRRYHWPNKPIAEGADYSMAEHVNDLETLIQLLNAAPAHIVGHSYGALVSLLLAVQSPQLVRTLVLAEPPAMTLFVSNSPKTTELLRLWVSRPRTAAAIMKFGTKEVAPATAALRRNNVEEARRAIGTADLGGNAYR